MRRRHDGTRWSLLFGAYDGVEKFAVDEAQRYFQNFLPYVIQAKNAEKPGSMDKETLAGHLLLVGTRKNNPLIAYLIGKGIIAAPKGTEGYALACVKSPWNEASKVVAVVGADLRGVLYGVERLGLTILPEKVAPSIAKLNRESLDNLAFGSLSERPILANRGIWSWGYVIYDYRRFIDNMARLKMNMLTIWNDVPPLNSRDVIGHAHSRGIEVILGFEWGWGRKEMDLTKKSDRDKIRREVIGKFERDYAHLGMDGIYFQTLTEHTDKVKGGVSVAKAAKELVNETAAEILAFRPGLLIQFGLHATSIGDRYGELAGLDPRVVVVWEDAGDIPFCYQLAMRDDGKRNYRAIEAWVDSPENTLEYSRKLAALRGGKDEFAIVPKGWGCLDWGNEFENHSSFILGERGAWSTRERLEIKRRQWDMINTLWLRDHRIAIRYYREMLKSHQGPMTACALVEDGMFEAEIQPSVALFAETVWDPVRPEEETLRLAYTAAAVANRM